MLKNYFKTAMRNLLRDRTSTILNLVGLTLGISCSIILFLIISFHTSFDTYHAKGSRIYRIVHQSDGNSGQEFQAGVPAVLPDAFRLDFPEAEEVIFTAHQSDAQINIPQRDGTLKKFQEDNGVVYTEPGFFRVFDRAMVHGDISNVLDEPNEAVISVSRALKYFGKEDARGEILRFGNHEFRVSAIMEDHPDRTDLPFSVMLSYPTVKAERESQGWMSIWSEEQCYILLKEDAAVEKVRSRLGAFNKKYRPDDADRSAFLLQPLMELHFDDRFDTYSDTSVPKSFLIALGVIAAILVFTACINFINLATAEAIKRSKEVGVRKTMGSTRAQLVIQFLSETTLITLIAVFVSIGLTQIAIGFINPFLNLNLEFSLQGSPQVLWYLVFVTVGVSLLSGLYPAFVVSGYQPAMALKNNVGNRSSSGYYLRSGLVVVQFFISQFFIIGTIVLIRQTDYFQKKDLGFSKEAILTIPIPSSGTDVEQASMQRKTFRNEVLTIPGVEAASLASSPPSSGDVSKTPYRLEGKEGDFITQVKQVDGGYQALFDLKLIAGKNILDLDTANGVLVNETFAKTLGFQQPADIVGEQVSVGSRSVPVTGVVKDFHTVSLQNEIEPIALMNNARGYRTLALKIDMNRAPEIISALKSRWEEKYPEGIFEFQFMEERIDRFYRGERKMATLLTVFTSLAITIGCLGLFGLAAFMANQKTKEIGVRKVLGASVESILIMFTREYVKLIIIGFVIAAPLAGFAMQQFLNEFAYRITLGPGIFLMGLSITLVIALLTVSYKSFRAAAVNPVHSLKSE